MPADLKMHELQIQMILNNHTDLTPDGVRTLMSLILLACYDRTVKREFMAEMIDATAEVNILMARMESGAKMRAALSMLKPDLKPTHIEEELANLCKEWAAKKAIIAKKFNMLLQCPTTQDTIH